jgi:hypothetical protein
MGYVILLLALIITGFVFVNVIRMSRISLKYGIYLFSKSNGPTKDEVHRLIKYILYFFLGMVAFFVLVFIAVYIQELSKS